MNMNINYPILCLAKEGSLIYMNSLQELKSCNLQAVKNKYYDDLLIFDSSGQNFKINEWQPSKPISAISKALSFILNPKITVDITLSNDVEQGIEFAKKMILNNLNKHKDFYDAGGELGILQSKVEKAITAKELINLFNIYA